MAAEVRPFLQPHGWPDAKACKRLQTVIRANWKLVAEKALECYHCGPSHPEFGSVMSYVGAMDSKRLAEWRQELTREWEEKCRLMGHKTGGIDFKLDTWWSVRRLPVREEYLTQSDGGRPVAPLMGSYQTYDGGITGFQIYPMNFLVGAGATFNRFTPIEVDHTHIEIMWLVRKDAVEGRDFDPEKVSWLWRVTGEADARTCEDNQKGVDSRVYEPGTYSLVEGQVEEFILLYLRQLRDRVQYATEKALSC